MKNLFFLCSPSLGILDNWLPIIYELKNKSSVKCIIVFPETKTLNQINSDNTLIKISENLFDGIVFNLFNNTFLKADNFSQLLSLNESKQFKLIFYLNSFISRFRLNNFFLKSFVKKIFHFEAFDFSKLDSNECVLLFDLHESEKSYNIELLKTFQNSKKFSLLHGINLRGLRGQSEKTTVKEVFNCTALVFSMIEKDFYKSKYNLVDKQIICSGIPRHDDKWVSFIKSFEKNNVKFNEYILILSRQVCSTVPLQNKIRYIKEIKVLSQKLNLPIVVKMHPKEIGENLYEDIFGRSNKNWIISNQHPFILAQNAVFCISFFSGVPIDMLYLAIPTIERLTLNGIKHQKDNFIKIDETSVSEYNYLGLVLGANNYQEMEFYANQILTNRKGIVDILKAKYLDIFNKHKISKLKLVDYILNSI